ncbi:hypothetical protein ACFWNK_19820 [Streptomyces sp. NPDC058417]|uniref:hypothetical protein n=1 Tax=unclassified Streptomyces TaxID=2593676 RepID=UPI0036466775
MTERTKVFTADIAERAVRVTWPDNDRGGATPPPDGWQDRAWAQEPTLHEIDEGSVSGCSILRWREDPRPDPELIGASLALVTGRPQAVPPAAAPPADRPLPPLLIGAQVDAYALVVRRQTCDDLAGELREDGQVLAADLVDDNRDFTEISRSLAAIPAAPKTEHGAYCRPLDCRCGCDRAQNCLDCHRCVCWREQCCAQVATDYARARARKTALRALLDAVDPVMLTELRETVAEAEEAALRDTIARRVRLLTPADGPRYTHAVFAAYDSKLGMGHADYRLHDVELHEDEDDDEDKHEDEGGPATVDLADDVLSAALGTLAGLLRPDEGADLAVDLTD